VGNDFNQSTFNPEEYELCKFVAGARSDGEVIDVICDQPLTGRYVTIYKLTAAAEHLTLCEVEVFGGE
jgi:hypothetical protein